LAGNTFLSINRSSPAMNTLSSTLPRREFLTGALALGATSLVRSVEDTPEILGPILGHSDETSAMIWMRAAAPGEFTLEVTPDAGGKPVLIPKTATLKDDLCLHWQVTGLQPATGYRYRILQDQQEIAAATGQTLTTAPKPDAPAKVRLAISSCAKEDAGSRAVWNRMAEEKVDAVVLIGDTPYIDSTELEKQTQRHREFAAVPEYQKLLRSRPGMITTSRATTPVALRQARRTRVSFSHVTVRRKTMAMARAAFTRAFVADRSRSLWLIPDGFP
jgi:alkaline phosphatase D